MSDRGTSPLKLHGDHNASRLSRLRWLDSTRWLDGDNSARYTPLRIHDSASGAAGDTAATSIEFLNRRIGLGALGLPSTISSNNNSILHSPISFSIVSATGRVVTVAPPASRLQLLSLGTGAASWTSHWSADADLTGGAAQELQGLSVSCAAELSSDGFVELNISLSSSRAVSLQDVQVHIPIQLCNKTWIMGLDVSPSGQFDTADLPAGEPVVSYKFSTYGVDVDALNTPNLRSSIWLGKPDSGLRVKFKGSDPRWNSPTELPELPPLPWANCKGNAKSLTAAAFRQTCLGTVNITKRGTSAVIESHTGPLCLAAMEPLSFVLDLMVTPVHPVDLQQHMNTRYVHLFGDVQTTSPLGGNPSGSLEGLVDLIATLGGTWAILHQGTSLNTFINSPINEDVVPALGQFVQLCRAKNISVKL